MHYEKIFINKTSLQYLVLTAGDLAQIENCTQINESNIAIDLDALKLLKNCSGIKNLVLRPGLVNEKELILLKGLAIDSLKLDYYSDAYDEYTIDLSWFPTLKLLVSRSSRNIKNVNECTSLFTLIVNEWLENDLRPLAGSRLKVLSLLQGKLKSLKGLEELHELLSLSISYQRSLSGISELSFCGKLDSLKIEKCPKCDYDSLPSLPNLTFLSLIGNQSVSDLGFLRRLPNLSFVILDINISDGQVDVLTTLKHSVLITDRKHYSKKDKDLPKREEKYSSLNIPEEFSVLPV